MTLRLAVPVGALLIVTFGACTAPVERLFTYSSDAPSRTGLTQLDNGVLLGNEAGRVVLLAPDGQVRWQAALGREVAARPAAAKGLAVVATVAGEVVGLSLEDGAEKWRVTDLPPVVAALATDGERAFVLATDGSARAFEISSGALVWARATLTGRKEPLVRAPEPVLAGGKLLVPAPDSGLLALRCADGALLWKAAAPGLAWLSADGAAAYAANGTQVTAFSLETGEPAWTRTLTGEAISAGPFVAQGTLLVAQGALTLVGLSPRDGAETWRTLLPAPVVGPPTAAGELLLVPTADRTGHLLGYRLDRAAPLFALRLDTALRTAPRVLGDTALVAGLDGRVFGLRLKPVKR